MKYHFPSEKTIRSVLSDELVMGRHDNFGKRNLYNGNIIANNENACKSDNGAANTDL